jgi:hypothetical protein
MMKLHKKSVYAGLLMLLMALMAVSVAYAITIVVDGVREAVWDTGAGGQLPGIQNDPDEPAITDGYDMQQVLWTNDQTNMYLLIQTFADTIWTGTPRPTIVICLDTDNSTITGGFYANCNNMSGIDRSIIIDRANFVGTTLNVLVNDGDPNTGTPINGGIWGARTTNVSEISIPLADLGLGGVTCTGNIQANVYFDNGIVDPDDNTPDSGTFAISCGSPTAVSMKNISTATTNPANWVGALALMLAVVTTGAVVVRRRQPTA